MIPRTLLTAAFALAGAHAALAQGTAIQRATHVDTLDNGLRVIVVENHTVPVASVTVAVRFGPLWQQAADSGAAQVMGRALLVGYRGQYERRFEPDVERLLGSYAEHATEEATSWDVVVPAARTSDAIGILARLVRHARLTNEVVAITQRVVIDGLHLETLAPRLSLDREVGRRLWGADWGRRDTIGTAAAVAHVTPAQLARLYFRSFVPNNAVLVVTGDVSPVEALRAAREHFGPWPRGEDPGLYETPPPEVAPDSSRAVVVTGNVSRVTVEIEWEGPGVRDDSVGAYAAQVLEQALDAHGSPFRERLAESGRFRSAVFRYRPLAHHGVLQFVGTTTMANLASALTVLQVELSHMRLPDYLDSVQLAAGREWSIVNAEFALEDAPALSGQIAEAWAAAGADPWTRYADRIRACTGAEVRRVVARYITGRPFALGVLAPPAEAPRVQEMLMEYMQMAGTP